MIRTIHPFPARMAPELALSAIADLPPQSVVLDPMAGSGTVVRQAADLGHDARGLDLDPLAVLMGRVWTTPVDDATLERIGREVICRAALLDEVRLDWIDDDQETANFIAYWFGPKQIRDLRRLVAAIGETSASEPDQTAALDVVRIALSRLIVTKENCASLARDTSHSRPHKVCQESDYEVLPNFERSLRGVRSRLSGTPPVRTSSVGRGDARDMDAVPDTSVDLVLTSPPYLNAIDYLRGHKLSLVWLGHQVAALRAVRSDSIGAERALGSDAVHEANALIRAGMGNLSELPKRFSGMIDRYVNDMRAVLAETARVLKPAGSATFVVGNSCLRGVFIRNSGAVEAAARAAGLAAVSTTERDLPSQSRYLPVTTAGALAKRMRTETILTFAHQ